MKVTVTIPDGAGKLLKAWSEYHLAGDTVEENASYLLMRAIGDMVGTPGFHHLLDAIRTRK